MQKKSKLNVFTFMMLIIIGLTFQPVISAYAACPDGITSYWKLDEASGSTYADFIGDNDGTGSADPADGTVNGAQQFDGATTGIEVEADRSFNWLSSDSFSIAAWVKIDSGIPVGDDQVIMGRKDAGATDISWFIAIDGDGDGGNGRALFALKDLTSGLVLIGKAGTINVADGFWHHVVAVRNDSAGAPNTGRNLLYVDGILQEESADINYADGFLSNSAEITIGWYDFSLTEKFRFEGLIDEVALYNRALEPLIEIPAYYTNGLAGVDYCEGSPAPAAIPDAPFPDDTISLWTLDEANGPDYLDAFDDNDGTGSADPADGTVNGAQQFDGATTGIEVEADRSFNWLSSDSFSIEAWVKIDSGIPVGDDQVIMGRKDAGATDISWFIAIDGDGDGGNGRALFALKDLTSGLVLIGKAGTINVADGFWHHVVAVRNDSAGAPNTGRNLLYVDGILQEESADINYADGFLSNSAEITIGWYDFSLTEKFRFEGLIDEVALYNQALEPLIEIPAHYTAGLAGNGVQSLRPAPVANAGVVPDVTEGAMVMLNGGDSTEGYDTAPLSTYVWEQLPGGTPVTINNDTATPTATFTAPPDVAAAGETLKFQLTVTASDGQSDSDTVDVGVVDSPVANAGADQNVTEGATVILNGSGSTGRNLTYEWTPPSGTGWALSDATAKSPTFTAPDVDVNGAILTFQLTVTDDVGATSPATVDVNVADASVSPVADAGDDQTVAPGAAVTLDGSGSTGTGLTYAWSQLSGTKVQLAGDKTDSPTFTAPTAAEISAAVLDTLTFQLTVTANSVTSTDTVDVIVDDSVGSGGGGGGGGGGGCFINSMF